MNTILIISLAIPATVSLIGVFVDKKKMKHKIILFGLIVGGLALTYILTYKNAAENEKYRLAEKESQDILKQANQKISQQSIAINEGFAKLNAQFMSSGINNAAFLSSFTSLQKQVGQFTTDSKDYITKVMSVADDNGLMNETIDKNSLKIPLGDGNARFIDGKNQLAVRNENPDRNGRIQVVLNGNTSLLAPADRVQYKNEFDRLCYLVYEGQKNGHLLFYVQER